MGFFWDTGGAANNAAQGNIGGAFGSLLGFDPTPGYNITKSGQLNSTAPVGATSSTWKAPSLKIADDWSPPTQDSGLYTGGGSGGASGGAASSQLADYDQQIGILNDALSRLGGQLGIAKGNVNRNYQTSINELNSGKAQNESNYGTSSTQNQQNLRTNKNAILDQQSSGLRGLMRQLGAYGAVGSDMKVASGAVQDIANQELSGAGQTFSQNQQGLDTNWHNYLTDWANSKNKADDWRTNQLNSAEQQSLSGQQDLLSQLAQARGKRAAAAGGDFAGGAAPDLASARALSGRIDSLGKINPTYTGNSPVYTAPSLSSYQAPQAAHASVGSSGNNLSANPSLALLLGLKPEDRRNQQLV
jgi:hypothetical protein